MKKYRAHLFILVIVLFYGCTLTIDAGLDKNKDSSSRKSGEHEEHEDKEHKEHEEGEKHEKKEKEESEE